MENTLIFSIVVYNEKYWDSVTFKSLLSSYHQSNKNEKIHILVFDNTISPNKFTPLLEENNVDVTYFSFNENRGISHAYNFLHNVATNKGFEWIVFLDQDTLLPEDFYQVYSNKVKETFHTPIFIPLVKLNTGEIFSPSVYRNFRHYKIPQVTRYLNLRDHSAINSGLLINCDFFKQLGGYNENLFLDFCDHDFFDKVRKEIDQIEILDVELLQNFSGETNELNNALVRYKIFLRDLNVYKKNKNKLALFFFVDLPHLLKITYKYKTTKFITDRLKNK
jgi:GT2 family glycosyltransferase